MFSRFLACVVCWMALLPAVAIAADAWQQAQEAVEQKQWDIAEQQLTLWLRQRPQDNEARFLLARVLAWQSRHEPALAQYTHLLRNAPDNADYLLGLAQVYFWRQQPLGAIPVLKHAQRVAPDYVEVWELLIRCLYASDQAAAAKDTQQLATQRFPARDWQRLTPELPAITARVKEPVQFLSPTERNTIVDVGGSFEKLDHQFASWHSAYLGGSHRFAERNTVYARASQVDRFALQDASILAGFTLPVSERWTLGMETDESPTNRFLPRWSLSGNAHYRMDYGFGTSFSFRHANYREVDNDTGTIGLERYWGNWRLAYTLYISQLELAPAPTFSHVGQAAYYYGDHDYVGVAIGGGQQVVRLGPGRLANAETESYALQGQHWLSPEWALVYDINLNVQGQSYTRRGAVFGLRYAY